MATQGSRYFSLKHPFYFFVTTALELQPQVFQETFWENGLPSDSPRETWLQTFLTTSWRRKNKNVHKKLAKPERVTSFFISHPSLIDCGTFKLFPCGWRWRMYVCIHLQIHARKRSWAQKVLLTVCFQRKQRHPQSQIFPFVHKHMNIK